MRAAIKHKEIVGKIHATVWRYMQKIHATKNQIEHPKADKYGFFIN